MNRYKQAILSNFFVTGADGSVRHLVEANLDIESRSDQALCTEILIGECLYEVLVNDHLASVCPICAAILARRIRSMPAGNKTNAIRTKNPLASPGVQLCLPGLT